MAWTAGPTPTRYAILWLGYVVWLVVLPTVFPPDATLPNVAARTGYNTGVAYLAIAVWSVLGFAFFALTATPALAPAAPSSTDTPSPSVGSDGPSGWRVCIVVGGLVAMLYWPPFLARYNHYIEDVYFMSFLGRMDCGQRPYQDFEFLYGPLMIYPAHLWIRVAGFSMQSYYALVALLQGSLFAVALRAFQHHVPDTRARYVAFVLFIPFVFDSLLGLNNIGWRVMPVVFAITCVAARPRSLPASVGAGSLVGVQLAYSVDYGVVALIAVAMVYAASRVAASRRDTIPPAIGFVAASVVSFTIIILALTGDTIDDYVAATAHVLRYAQGNGVGNFSFYWTLNSLSLFGLLSVGVAVVGAGLRHLRTTALTYGDRLLLGTLLFAIGSLRAAFQRADVWHLTMPFIPLIAAFLWGSSNRAFPIGRHARRVVWALIAVAAVTRGIGLLPTGSHFLTGWARGAMDVAAGRPEVSMAGIESRRHSAQAERSEADPDRLALAALLASPAYRQRPVVFYDNLWWLGLHTGVCPSGYSFFQLMYSDGYRPMTAMLDRAQDTIAVMEDSVYRRLFNGDPPGPRTVFMTPTQRLGAWVSSVHNPQKGLEAEIKYEVWQRNLGDYLAEHYERTRQFGDFVVLERRPR